MEKKKYLYLLTVLRSGAFTVASHDYGQVSIYEGRHKGYLSKEEMPEFPEKELISFDLSDNNGGYMQKDIELFTDALDGTNGGSA